MSSNRQAMSGSASKTVELPASAADVWAVIGDFNGLPRWNAGVERSDLSNDGKRRTLTLKAGGTVVEDLVDFNEAGRSLSYSIVDGPIPVSRHKATIAAIESGPGQSIVRWSCEFEPNGAPTEVVAGIFSGIFEGGLKQLAQMFGGKDAPQ